MGWDQQIYYTYKPNGRWILPGLYWSRTVQFKTFTADFWFLDNNLQDARPPEQDPEHNICSKKHNPGEHCEKENYPSQGDPADCGGVGPHNPWDCYAWFKARWTEQYNWLLASVKASTAEWQIVVTHYPADFSITPRNAPGIYWPTWSKVHGIDVVVAGHRHDQEVHYKVGKYNNVDFGDLAWVVSGGG